MAEDFYPDDDTNEETVGQSGFDVVESGKYHLHTCQVNEKEDSIEVDLEVMDGTKPAERGKVFRAFMSKNDKKGNRNQRLAYAIATNMVTHDQIRDAREQGKGLSFDYAQSANQHLAAEVVAEEKKEKDSEGNYTVGTGIFRSKFSYDHIYHVDSKEVAKLKIPIDRQKIPGGIAGIDSPASQSSAPPADKPIDF